jgi:sarcosine oxidase subunit alpha
VRLPTGGWVDRSHPVRFTFDRVPMEALAGDTLASALLSNGIIGGFRSPILGRPRGVMTAGPEEPNAFVELTTPRFDVTVPSTMVNLVDGLSARALPGVGRLPDPAAGAERTRASHRYVHVESLVVGGGVAGLRAALDAAGKGDRVLLADERAWLGGLCGPSETVDDLPAWSWAEDAVGALSGAADVTLLSDAPVLGLYDAGYAVIHERGEDVLWHVRARQVVLATGAHERPIAFGANDLPGVMLAGAVAAYVERFAVCPWRRAAVLTTNDTGYRTARVLRAAGVEVSAVDVRPYPADPATTSDDLTVHRDCSIASASGDGRVQRVHLTDGRTLEVDLVAVSGGWNPAAQLWRAVGGTLRYEATVAAFVPDHGPAWISVTGRAAGNGLPVCEPHWITPADQYAEHFVDLQRDQTVADVAVALDSGLRSVEHVKRATYIGTAADQGRVSGVLAAEVVNHLLGADPGAQGPTSARPPWSPVSFHVLGGPYVGDLFDPVRVTPIHPWHEAHGAAFENVGQWSRAWYFAEDGESMGDAALRECAAVRTGVGMMDASTLGKIEVVGPDAGMFLDRMYTNRMSTLRPGRIRYGIMLGLDGMVFDDGVAMRLAEDRYLVTTTTGGAARVLDRFEEWLQTEWPDLRVYCTSVTEQWATIAVAGPRARDVVAAAGTDVDLSRDAFPFMAWRDGAVARMDARLARVSFSGELAYEVNVAGTDALRMWETLFEAGSAFGITPYGTEAMHVLRAEKAFPIVGQDTDGTVTPDDLGMSWIVDMAEGDFIGRRSLRRPDTARAGRRQLVALLPEEPDELIPEGAQVVASGHARATPPVPSLGHVTSSYRSATLGRTFALALVADGRSRVGTSLCARWPRGVLPATVADPVLYDPERKRRDG